MINGISYVLSVEKVSSLACYCVFCFLAGDRQPQAESKKESGIKLMQASVA